MRKTALLAAAAALACVPAAAIAGQGGNSDVEFTEEGLVCPVITTENVLHSPKGAPISEGHYTIGGPHPNVPVHATNGDGTGQPDGEHSAPGDEDYTAIWNLDC